MVSVCPTLSLVVCLSRPHVVQCMACQSLTNKHIIQAWAENRLSGKWLSIIQIKQGGICCDRTIVRRNWNVMLFVCVGWRGSVLSPSGHLFRAFRAASDNCPWDNNRCSPLFFKRMACWPLCVRVTVAVNSVCASKQCTCETCVRARYCLT